MFWAQVYDCLIAVGFIHCAGTALQGQVQANRHAIIIKHEGNYEHKLVLQYYKELKILEERRI